LRNSQGWQGVFGNEFAALLKGNEAKTKEWAQSQNQAHLLVKDSLTMLNTMAQQTFQTFAQAEGQAIASAIVYSKSIGKAMEAALAATLESLAAQAMVHAIYSLGWGFKCLAEYDYVGASNSFTAAAIFGSLGVGSAIAGRA